MKQLINFKKEKHFLHLAILCILIEIISMSKCIDSNLSMSSFTGQAAQWGFHFFKRKLFIFRDIMSKSVKKKVKRKNLNIVVLSSSWDTLFVSLTRNKFSMYP